MPTLPFPNAFGPPQRNADKTLRMRDVRACAMGTLSGE